MSEITKSFGSVQEAFDSLSPEEQGKVSKRAGQILGDYEKGQLTGNIKNVHAQEAARFARVQALEEIFGPGSLSGLPYKIETKVTFLSEFTKEPRRAIMHWLAVI
jgi:hypothetical protein